MTELLCVGAEGSAVDIWWLCL